MCAVRSKRLKIAGILGWLEGCACLHAVSQAFTGLCLSQTGHLTHAQQTSLTLRAGSVWWCVRIGEDVREAATVGQSPGVVSLAGYWAYLSALISQKLYKPASFLCLKSEKCYECTRTNFSLYFVFMTYRKSFEFHLIKAFFKKYIL